ncbi:lipopolysaccharide biosynthesis protein [Chachezhania sediminis]|uniref:lipopolysaccharide biosynthesis protein n=1 Tax=Chachezhania sediminis TaxID=2599291 RepID=UPI00131B89EE|nr:lipopolysaccharide biosynthesis protein [Chachezhania sediminis]
MSQSVGQSLTKKLARGGASSLFVKIASAGLSFFMFIVIARGMTADGFALFGFGFSAATLMVLGGSMGQRVGALRFIPVHMERGDIPGMRGFTRRGYLLVLGGCAILSLLFVLASEVSDRLTGGFYPWTVAFFTVSLGLAEYQSHVLRAHGSIVLALAPREVIWRAAVVALFAIPAIGLSGPIPVTWGFLVISLMLLALTIVQAGLYAETRPQALLRSPVSYESRTEWDRSAWVFWSSSVLSAATPNVAMLIVGVLLSAEDSGAFFAALRLAMVVNLFMVAANMLAMPMMSAAHERGDMDGIRDINRFVVLFTGIPGALFFLLFLLEGGWTLALFNKEFSFAHWALVLVAGGYLVRVLSGPAPAMLQMMGQERRYMKMLLWAIGVLLASLVPLVWAFGIHGAAVAAGLEQVATGVFGVWMCRRSLKIDPSVMCLVNKGRVAAG